MHGKYININGNMVLMNDMCDMSQFVVVVPVTNGSFDILAEIFSQHVLMKFGVYHLVVIDDDPPFKDAFVTICLVLALNYDILAKRNHKGLTIENFHRFLNKAATKEMEDRQNNDVFFSRDSRGYAWNSAPIDGTDILHSVVAIGREFRFSIDINLSALPQLTHNNIQSIIDYLRLVGSIGLFSSSILKLSIEDRRTIHA